ncbi:6694_t:CDS:2 [Gigaspora margarita]|uniref:6694_t:CDS:1 n=1 Tax=Gigaspora margarita TaxID=4874 RepID=A0ABM8VX53_GIGMA|nr:6694_t:CDS:2 [Gigaspora margarita]
MNRCLKLPIYNLYQYFCNQSIKFHTALRKINEELKKNENYVDGYIFSAAYKYVTENKRRICGNNSRTSNESIVRDALNNTIESTSKETSNNTIDHSSNNQPTLTVQNHSSDQLLMTSSNPENQKPLVVKNSLNQSQHQVINIITDDNNQNKTDLKFKIEGLEKDNTELKSKNAGLEKDNEKLRSANKTSKYK